MLVAASLVLLWPAADVAQANPLRDADAGQRAWGSKTCRLCHGQLGEGKYAPPIAGYDKTLNDLTTQARTPFKNMPAFNTTQMSDAELSDILDYLKTLTKPASFTPFQYEAKPGDEPGKVLFNQKRCAACHGENAERLVSLVTASGRKTISLEEVQKQVRNPRRFMPAFSATAVTDDDIAVIAPFIKATVEKATGFAPTPVPAVATPATPIVLPKTGDQPFTPMLALLTGFVSMACIVSSLMLRRRPNH